MTLYHNSVWYVVEQVLVIFYYVLMYLYCYFVFTDHHICYLRICHH